MKWTKHLNRFPKRKKRGHDNIEPAMLKNMSDEIKRGILETYNNSCERGIVPGQWKKVVCSTIKSQEGILA